MSDAETLVHEVGMGSDRFVYMVQSGVGGPIKIGVTRDVLKRVRSLSTASAVPLSVLRVMRGGEMEERSLQARFMSAHINGEWFRPTEEILQFSNERDSSDVDGPTLALRYRRPGAGRPKSTGRGRTAGAREARTWLSAAEYAEVERQAQAAGLTTAGWVRVRLLGER